MTLENFCYTGPSVSLDGRLVSAHASHMTVDEPAMWNLIPAAKRERVLIAAKAMCRSRDADTEPCTGCDDGTCVAFGLYGQMAINVLEALDRHRD